VHFTKTEKILYSYKHTILNQKQVYLKKLIFITFLKRFEKQSQNKKMKGNNRWQKLNYLLQIPKIFFIPKG
jgi:hypothetical protein